MQTAKTIIDQKKRGIINKKQSDDYMRKLFQLQHSKVTIPDKFAIALEFPNLTPVKIRKKRFFKNLTCSCINCFFTKIDHGPGNNRKQIENSSYRHWRYGKF